MGLFLVKQPNGLYCRYSTYTDCPVMYNITREEYIEIVKEEAAKEAERYLDKVDIGGFTIPTFDMMIEKFIPREMSWDKFEEIIKEMGYIGVVKRKFE